MKKKVVILGNQARATSNFWTVLIRTLIAYGHEVICLIPYATDKDDGQWEKQLIENGAILHFYHLDRKGLNPFQDGKTLWDLYSFFRRERPDVLFAFTIKPVIYGAFAAALGKFPSKKHRLAMITGLGFMFEGDSFIKRMLMKLTSLLYKLAFLNVNTIFFQNIDDKNFFERMKIIPSGVHVAMTKGTGVDLQHFSVQPLPKGDIHFLFVGRLLQAKGVQEFCEAASIIHKKYPNAKFSLLGPQEQGLGSFPLSELQQWQEKGDICYLGETHDVRPFLAKANVIVLPSWREGTPCSLMEAMSVGRPVVAADAPGSREVVSDGNNGFLVPVKNAEALATALEKFIFDPELLYTMGKQSRTIVETQFDANIVAKKIIDSMGI